MPDNSWSTAELAEALKLTMPTGSPFTVILTGDCTIVDITAREKDVLVTFLWMAYPYTLGFAIGTDSQYSEAGDSESPRGWASDAALWLQEELATGLIVEASRHQHDDIIELGARDWPNDERFYSSPASPAGPDDEYARDSIDYFERDGFDTTIVRAMRADNTLISWERTYVNNRNGSPFVGHAAIARVDSDIARIAYCDVAPDVPETVALELCLGAAHAASWHGAQRVITDLDNPVLDILGFQHIDGQRQLKTDFLHVDHAAAAELLAETQHWHPPRRMRPRRFTTRVRFAG